MCQEPFMEVNKMDIYLFKRTFSCLDYFLRRHMDLYMNQQCTCKFPQESYIAFTRINPEAHRIWDSLRNSRKLDPNEHMV